ncbi:MAG TPA: glycosyltransferase [Rhodanobacter sp.]|nr:glycosyltransferase [Rhodanobacter sp.]
MKRVLMIAFHFPPAALGSGHLRTLGFARYLPEQGWEPAVLSASAKAFPRVDAMNLSLIPDNCRVRRAFALDVRRHLSIRGKYPGFLAQPDGWASWWPAAVIQGLSLIKRYRVKAIWSTYPIMTAHCIAYTLSRLTGLPWIADFRDPVSSSVEAENPFSVGSQHRWEQRILRRATRVVFTTRGARDACAARYPDADRAGKLAVIENGYDEAAFAEMPSPAPRQAGSPLVLLHSGALYPDGRDPFPFFEALARLRAAGKAGPDIFRVVLRASSCETRYRQEIDRLGLADIVSLAPPIGNREALFEQASADALLLFQGSKFDRQIPAKLYEYLRIGRPIFALVGESGDTEALLRDAGGAEVVPIADVSGIELGLARFVECLLGGGQLERSRDVARWSRRRGATDLAHLLDEVVA